MNKPLETSSTFGQVSQPEPERQLRVGEFDKRQLEPYRDIDFFKRRVFSQSRILRRNPDLIGVIGDALAADDDGQLQDAVELIEIARTIDAPANETVLNKMLSTMALQSQLMDIHKDRCDDGTAYSLVTLTERMYRQIANEPTDQQVEEYKSSTEFIIEQLSKIPEDKSSEGQKVGWMKRRLDVLDHTLDERINVLRYVLDMPNTDAEFVTDDQVVSDSEEISELFNQAHNRQSYGVKLSYKNQTSRPGSLVFQPGKMLESILNDAASMGEIDLDNSYERMQQDIQKNELCVVTDSPKKSYHEGIQFKAKISNDGELDFQTNIKSRFTFVIHPDGSIRSGVSELGDILTQTAARYGRYNSFRSLQAEIITDYLDLTNPVELTNRITRSSATKSLAQVSSDRANNDNSVGMDVVRTLMIPRIKARQSAEGSDTPRTEDSREVRLHGVVWHIRRLPEGWHASPQAREIASEAGVTLGSSETFVQAHKRGSAKLGEVVSHQLIRRS